MRGRTTSEALGSEQRDDQIDAESEGDGEAEQGFEHATLKRA